MKKQTVWPWKSVKTENSKEYTSKIENVQQYK